MHEYNYNYNYELRKMFINTTTYILAKCLDPLTSSKKHLETLHEGSTEHYN